jgi:hypothetical protein
MARIFVLRFGTGWISELHPRKGVLTFDNNGVDERVLMLASKVYFFEKRIGAKQPLNRKYHKRVIFYLTSNNQNALFEL